MCQPIEEIARQLQDAKVLDKNVMDPELAIIYARFRGRCGYCHRDLIADRFRYACAEIDHLLPKSTYPAVADNPLNWVLACRLCNSTKLTYDVLRDGGVLGGEIDPQEALENEDERNLLIQAASTYVHNRLHNVHNPRWEIVKRIVLGRPYCPDD